jgi:hypothetical protein
LPKRTCCQRELGHLTESDSIVVPGNSGGGRWEETRPALSAW